MLFREEHQRKRPSPLGAAVATPSGDGQYAAEREATAPTHAEIIMRR